MPQTLFLTRMSAQAARSSAWAVFRSAIFCLRMATLARCSSISRSVFCSALRIAPTNSSPTTGARPASNCSAYFFCWSMEARMPMANSAQSSNSEFDHVGPRPSLFTQYGVVGRLPP